MLPLKEGIGITPEKWYWGRDWCRGETAESADDPMGHHRGPRRVEVAGVGMSVGGAQSLAAQKEQDDECKDGRPACNLQ